MIEDYSCYIQKFDSPVDGGCIAFDPKEHVRCVRGLVRSPGTSVNASREIINSSNAYLLHQGSFYVLECPRGVRDEAHWHVLQIEDDESDEEIVQQRFKKLARQWKLESRFVSSVTKKCMLLSYQQIIEMGQAVVPLILSDLKSDGPNDWFWALTKITGENPITHEIAGNMLAMTEAWLKWGIRKGLMLDSHQTLRGAFRTSNQLATS